MRIQRCLIVGLALWAAQVPLAASGLVAPDGAHWVSIDRVEPLPGSDELLPTVRLRLVDRAHPKGFVLLEGAKSLCDTMIRWEDNARLYLRVPEERLTGLRVIDGQSLDKVQIRLDVHQDQVLLRKESPDRSLSLLVIAECESGHWNLYLRRKGEPDYTPAMQTGWDDPQLFGGFIEAQPVLALEWTGPREACVEVAQSAFGMTLRHQVQGVQMDWVFHKDFKRAAPPEGVLGSLKKRP